MFFSYFNLDKNKVDMYEVNFILIKYFYMVKKDNLKKEFKNNYFWENLSVLSKNICLSCFFLSII